MLSNDIERYVELKRACGLKFEEQDRLLKKFAIFSEASGDEFVCLNHAFDWAGQGTTLRQRRKRLLTVRRFAIEMRAEDSRHEVPAADAFGREHCERPRPYIYTPEEIAKLIGAASRLEPSESIKPLTYVTFFGLLAATGLRVSEARSLKIVDVTEDGLIIRETKFHKTRLVPLHETTRQALLTYISARIKLVTLSDALFVLPSGVAPTYPAILETFLQLAYSTGLREPGKRGARIHDLRHTFAVQSLEQCKHNSGAVSRHMTALSTYLGHGHINSTYWYLEATPILLTQIAEASEYFYLGGAS